MKRTVIVLAGLALTGCNIVPASVSLEHLHASHPLLGPPFGPSNEEDTQVHRVIARAAS